MTKSFIHFLPAQHGDAFIMHCFKGGAGGIVVVDGGASSSNARLNPFLTEVEKLDCIDLMVLTHHDCDHIDGLLGYIKKHISDDTFPVKEIWANCAKHVDFNLSDKLSVGQAVKLADFLNSMQDDNKILWRSDINTEQGIISLPFADIEIIGPLPQTYRRFMQEYGTKVVPSASPISSVPDNNINLTCECLAQRPKTPPNPNDYQILTNMASISFILRCDGLSVLMLGDSFPQETAECLIDKGYSVDNKLTVDYVKVAHHGSRNNISNDLLNLIDCNKYIISTNGGMGRSHHPQREAIANILCHPERKIDTSISLFFNYRLDTIERYGHKIFNHQIDKNLNYTIYEPDTENTINTGYFLSACE